MRRALLALSLVASTACAGGGNADDPEGRPPSTVTFEDQEDMSAVTLWVDVADDDGERRRGLMEVEHLPAEEGMAFVFDEPTSGTFWMKNTLIPLSIAFVGEDGSVVGVLDMEPCEADPCPSYGIDDPYVLAIEANQGWFEDNDIGVGDRAELRTSGGMGGMYG
jgi:uncharacterized membrane protein (UPF0127 family)